MILVRKPGMLSQVQDLGREGWRALGFCTGGALDTLALRLANRLVGNADDAAGIEITMGHCELQFEADTRIALTGGGFGARLDGVPLAPAWSQPVRAGQTLVLGGLSAGRMFALRSWLAVAGGIDVPAVLGSRSTDLQAGFGGYAGRALCRGDRLPIGPSRLDAAQLRRRAFGARLPAWDRGDAEAIALRALPGPEHEQFTAAARQALWSVPWRITPRSNRMGCRLDGPELVRRRHADMLPCAVVPGTAQVPPSGRPIVLMGDAQTAGSYPRIAVVIRADLWKLAQAPLGAALRFVRVDTPAALTAWDAQQRYLALVTQGLAAMDWPVAADSS